MGKHITMSYNFIDPFKNGICKNGMCKDFKKSLISFSLTCKLLSISIKTINEIKLIKCGKVCHYRKIRCPNCIDTKQIKCEYCTCNLCGISLNCAKCDVQIGYKLCPNIPHNDSLFTNNSWNADHMFYNRNNDFASILQLALPCDYTKEQLSSNEIKKTKTRKMLFLKETDDRINNFGSIRRVMSRRNTENNLSSISPIKPRKMSFGNIFSK
jgi:hypothetical protein